MDQTNSISKKVLEKIMEGKVKMKPKALFVLQTVMLVLLAFVSLMLAVFLTSFAGFALNVKGYSPFLMVVILSVILFIILAWLLAKKFSLFYKKPRLFGIAIILISVAMVSLAVFLTPFHQKIMEYSERTSVPIISPFYQCGCGCSESHICGFPKNTNINSQPNCGCLEGSQGGQGSCGAK